MKKFLEFISYHNAIPIFFGILFLGSGVTFAASPEARDLVFDSEEVVRSIDNSYIISVDVEHYSFGVQIIDVTEDEEYYFVTYQLNSIDLHDGAWRDVIKQNVISVSKHTVFDQDLGEYVTKQLAQVRDAERARLLETQNIERSVGQTQKVVATEYSGLVGRVLSDTEEVLEGYAPVIQQPVATHSATEQGSNEPSVLGASTGTGTDSVSDGRGPVITIFGNNPAHIARGVSYADLGFIALDNGSDNVATYMYLGDKKVKNIILDTSQDSTYTIVYEAIDPDGNVTRATRTVIVGEGTPVQEPAQEELNTETSSASTTADVPE